MCMTKPLFTKHVSSMLSECLANFFPIVHYWFQINIFQISYNFLIHGQSMKLSSWRANKVNGNILTKLGTNYSPFILLARTEVPRAGTSGGGQGNTGTGCGSVLIRHYWMRPCSPCSSRP